MNSQQVKFAMVRLLSGILLAVGVLLGLWVIQQGLEDIFVIRGADLAIPGDDINELEVLSTREVVLKWNSALRIILGLGMIFVTMYVLRWTNFRLTTDKAIPENNTSG